MSDLENLPVPGQDPRLWNNRLFKDIMKPADWCTIRQAAEQQESGMLGSGGDPNFEIPDEDVEEYLRDPVAYKASHNL
jgi:hypothetical protein